jgi:hypothetical protein
MPLWQSMRSPLLGKHDADFARGDFVVEQDLTSDQQRMESMTL